MNIQDRHEMFIREYEDLCARTGFQWGARLEPEILGVVLQVRPATVIIPIQGWVENPDSSVGKTKDSEKGAGASNLAQKE